MGIKALAIMNSSSTCCVSHLALWMLPDLTFATTLKSEHYLCSVSKPGKGHVCRGRALEQNREGRRLLHKCA